MLKILNLSKKKLDVSQSFAECCVVRTRQRGRMQLLLSC